MAHPIPILQHLSYECIGYIEGHLVPIIKFGFEALGGAAGAAVYLEADAFARVSVEVEAHVTANIGTAAPTAHAHPKKGKRDAYLPPYSRRARSELAPRDADTGVHGGAKGGFSGCVWLEAGLELNFGADANLGDIRKVKASGSLCKSPIWTIWSVSDQILSFAGSPLRYITLGLLCCWHEIHERPSEIDAECISPPS